MENPQTGFRSWLKKKWETAEEWLPWFMGITAGLVLVVGLVVGYFQSKDRNPAGFVAVSDSVVPANSIYADETTESLSGKSKTGKKSEARQSARSESTASKKTSFVIALKTNPSEAEIEKRTGIPAIRSRAVMLATDTLLRPHGEETVLPLELFKDVAPVFVLKVTSGFEVNSGMHSGTAPDDPSSHAELTTANGMVSGFIKYRGKEYRIVSDPERGIHYIVEVKRP